MTDSAALISSLLHSDDAGVSARVALATRDGDGWKELTYEQLNRQSARVRDWLRAHDARPGDRVGIMGQSGNDWVAAFLGTLRCGAIVVPLDPRLTTDELSEIWASSTPTALIVDRRLCGAAAATFERLRLAPAVLVVDDISAGNGPAGNKAATTDVDTSLPMERPALAVWTSGTTGAAKGVVLTFANLDYVVTQSMTVQGSAADNRWLSVLPLSHMLELSCGLLPSLRSGATFCFARSLMPREVVEAMRQRGTTRMVVVPLVLRLLHGELAAQPAVAGGVDALFSGGAPLARDLIASYADIGIPVYQGYGLTELAPVVSMNSAGHDRPGSVGRPLPGAEVRIEEQEILIRSPGLMAGYWLDDDLTRTVIDADGWFHTGDLGEIDAEGYLYVTGRAKNVIVLESGKKVHPEEVESVLIPSDLFTEVCVVAVRARGHPAGPEQVCAVVVPTSEVASRHSHDDDLHAALAEEVRRRTTVLSGYKRPTVVEVWKSPLPTTAKTSVCRAEVARLAGKCRVRR